MVPSSAPVAAFIFSNFYNRFFTEFYHGVNCFGVVAIEMRGVSHPSNVGNRYFRNDYFINFLFHLLGNRVLLNFWEFQKGGRLVQPLFSENVEVILEQLKLFRVDEWD